MRNIYRLYQKSEKSEEIKKYYETQQLMTVKNSKIELSRITIAGINRLNYLKKNNLKDIKNDKGFLSFI